MTNFCQNDGFTSLYFRGRLWLILGRGKGSVHFLLLHHLPEHLRKLAHQTIDILEFRQELQHSNPSYSFS